MINKFCPALDSRKSFSVLRFLKKRIRRPTRYRRKRKQTIRSRRRRDRFRQKPTKGARAQSSRPRAKEKLMKEIESLWREVRFLREVQEELVSGLNWGMHCPPPNNCVACMFQHGGIQTELQGKGRSPVAVCNVSSRSSSPILGKHFANVP